MRFYFIRHGKTGRNDRPDLIGQDPEEELSNLGKTQAALLGNRLKNENLEFAEVFCSPYRRAIDTCKLALPDVLPTVIDDLKEYSTGAAINQSRLDLITYEVLDEMEHRGMHWSWPEGESMYDVEQRASKWLYQALIKYKDKEVNLAIFSHGQTIKCLLHFIMQFENSLTWRLSIDNTSISIADYKLEHWFIKSINDTSHLKETNK